MSAKPYYILFEIRKRQIWVEFPSEEISESFEEDYWDPLIEVFSKIDRPIEDPESEIEKLKACYEKPKDFDSNSHIRVDSNQQIHYYP